MIADVFLGWIAGLVEWVADIWPTWNLPNLDVSGVAGYLDDINYLLPLGEVFAAVLAVLLVGVPFAITTLSLWVVALIRGGSSRG